MGVFDKPVEDLTIGEASKEMDRCKDRYNQHKLMGGINMDKHSDSIVHAMWVFALKFMILVFLGVFLWQFVLPVNETDRSFRDRSGMYIITDEGTGMQYLYKNGLTPRLDMYGNHMYYITGTRN